jgi:acyl-CoA dehydrogenase
MALDNVLLDGFVRLLAQISPSTTVRRAEEDGDVAEILRDVEESGFMDALVPESRGGSGLSLSDVVPLFLAAGEHLLPIPFAETMVARAMIAAAGVQSPPGRTIVLWPAAPAGRLISQVDPLCERSTLALMQRGTEFRLLPMAFGERCTDPFRMWSARPEMDASPLAAFELPHVDLLHWAAAITAANMAGAMERLLGLSLAYVNDRQQFGRSIGKFQAIQQQLSVLAEKTVAARVAARIGLTASTLTLDGGRVAIAKSVANESARTGVSIAHAVHGAIGISEAHELQLYTRRLARWLVSFGSDAYWQRYLGGSRLKSPEPTSVDFVRTVMVDPVAC